MGDEADREKYSFISLLIFLSSLYHSISSASKKITLLFLHICRLLAMPEIERENILSERYTKRKEMRDSYDVQRRLKAEQRANRDKEKKEGKKDSSKESKREIKDSVFLIHPHHIRPIFIPSSLPIFQPLPPSLDSSYLFVAYVNVTIQERHGQLIGQHASRTRRGRRFRN